MGWRETLNMPWREALGYDRTKGPGVDWTERFDKIHDPAQLRRKFAWWALSPFIYLAAAALLLVYIRGPAIFTEIGFYFAMLLFPPILLIHLWCMWRAYTIRKKQLAGEVGVSGPDNLTRLRRRFVPVFGGMLYAGVILILFSGWCLLSIDSVNWQMLIPIGVILSIIPIFFWYHWRWYNQLKRELGATDSTESIPP